MSDARVEILLVEDNPNDVQLALHAIREHRIADVVHVARDGVEALDYLFCRGEHAGRDVDKPPRLVLLDLKLPKLNGMDVLRRVKSELRTMSIPVVVLTSSTNERDIAECYRLGVNSFVSKPVDFDVFSRAVKQLGDYWLRLNEAAPAGGRPSSRTLDTGCDASGQAAAGRGGRMR